MAVFFNLETLTETSKGDPTKFLNTLEKLSTGRILNLDQKRKLIGSSFLLNPFPLFNRDNIDILYKIQYIKLAAKRDYSTYKLLNFAGLDLTYFPDINKSSIQRNPLLNINKHQIQFLYEEKE